MSAGGSGLVEQVVGDPLLPVRVVAVIAFFGLVLVGSTLYYEVIRDSPVGSVIEEAISNIEDIGAAPKLLLPLIIFLNNVVVALRVVLFSFTIILPFVDVGFNAVVVSYVIADSILAGGLGDFLPTGSIPQYIFAVLTPHGSIEIPALGVAASTAFYMVDHLKGRKVGLLRVAKRNFLLTLYMLMVAAILEVTVSVVFAIIALIL